ncbi:hypothetical protein Tco_1119725 [Tanacetum coccineum]
MLMIKIFSERRILERERSVRKFVQRGCIWYRSVPDVPKYDSESDKESWGNSGEEEEDDDDTEDDEGNDDDDDGNDGDDDYDNDDNDGNADDDSDHERTE